MLAMATSVKMREGDKAQLEQLQAAYTSRFGHRITQEELLARLVALGAKNLDSLGAPSRPKDADEVWQRMLSCIVHGTGKRTREEDIDRILYGRPPA